MSDPSKDKKPRRLSIAERFAAHARGLRRGAELRAYDTAQEAGDEQRRLRLTAAALGADLTTIAAGLRADGASRKEFSK